jgi:hypothetical protein
MTTTFCSSFTTAMRMINWIHRRATNMGTPAKPTTSASFSEPNIHML